MRVLFLGMPDSPLLDYLSLVELAVAQTMDPLDEAIHDAKHFDFVVSYGYRRIISKRVLDNFPDRAINLHISLLPWNKGADPNLWSFVDRTPKGVTIHYLDEGVDTGDIIVQKEVPMSEVETLKSSYDRLHAAIQELFISNWASIRSGTCGRTPQRGKGSFHRSKDKARFAHLLRDAWDTPVSELSFD